MRFPKIDNLRFIAFIIILVLAFFYFTLGKSGFMSALGIILFFYIPTYFILNNFDLRQDEKIIFSFFLGVGIFPSLVYWMGMFISLRVTIFIAFLVLISIGILIPKFKNKK